jgi:PKD repeat protein
MKSKVALILLLVLLAACLVGGAGALNTTIYPPSTNADGKLGYSGSLVDWATLQNINGNLIINTTIDATVSLNATKGLFDNSTGMAFVFNTSALGLIDNTTIDSASIWLRGDTAKQDLIVGLNLSVISLSPANPEVLAASDWERRNTSIRYSSPFADARWNGSDYNAIPFTNLSAINTNGYTSLIVVTGWDALNSPPASTKSGLSKIGMYETSSSGTTRDPYLNISYHHEKEITMVGDSITEGRYSTAYRGVLGAGGYLRDPRPNWSVFNGGHSGEDTLYLLSTFASEVLEKNSTVAIYECGNDISHGYTFEETVSHYLEYENVASTNGTTVYYNTIPPRGYGPFAYTSGQEIIRQQFNTWLKSNFTPNHAYRYYFDLNATLSDPTNTSQILAAYTYDGTHLSDAGYEVWGRAIDVNFPDMSSPIIASFTPNNTVGYQSPYVVSFTDTTTGSPVSWNWNFGDGYTSTLQNPQHVYTVANNYTVSLNVSNVGGAYNVATNNVVLETDDDIWLKSWMQYENATVLDFKGTAWTASGATISTLQKKWGASSLAVTAGDAYISTPSSSSWDWGTSNAVLEGWVYPTTIVANKNLISRTTGTGSGNVTGWALRSNNSATGYYFRMNGYFTPSFTLPLNTWTLLKIERDGGDTEIYKNGEIISDTAMPGNHDTANPVLIGQASGGADNAFYVDEVRFTNGISREVGAYSPNYAAYNGNLFVSYMNINPNATLRYKTNPTDPLQYAYNGTPRNRTVQIQNITNATHILGTINYDRLHIVPVYVVLNTTVYNDMVLVSSSVDATNGIVNFNVLRALGISALFDNRTPLIDVGMNYYNYTSEATFDTSFGSGDLIDGQHYVSYPIQNFINTPIGLGMWTIKPDFSANATAVNVGSPIKFTDTGQGEPTGFTNYLWNFGDGSTSTQQNPTYAYSANGNYTVSLVASLVANSSVTNSTSKTGYITVTGATLSPPVANFAGVPTTVVLGSPVTFTDLSTNVPTTWVWAFGDGASSSLQNPSHVYSAIGNYTVNLTVANAFGSNTSSKVNYTKVQTSLSGFNQVDLTMDQQFTLTVNIVDSTTNLPIPVVLVMDSLGNEQTTTVGEYVGTYPYSTVVLYLTSSGYDGKSAAYIMDSDRSEIVQMVKTVTIPNPSVVYIPQQVRIRIIDLQGYPLNGVTVTATPLNFTAPSNWTEILFGINPAVNIVGTTVYGTTGSDGSWVAPMLPSIKYNLTMVRVSDVNYNFQIYPSQTEYTFTLPIGLVPIPTSAANIVTYSLSNASIRSTQQYINMSYSDTSVQGTNYLKFAVYNLSGATVASTVYTGAAANSKTYSQIITVSQGQSYTYAILANQSEYGWINQTKTVTFANQVALIGSAPGWVEQFVAIGLIIIFAALFSIFSKTFAMVGIPILTWYFQFVLGWLPSTFLSTIALGTMLTLGVLMYIRQRENMIQ